MQVQSKAGKPDVVVCKWLNFLGKDGLNARIVSMLPIERGSAGEFFFKSASTTTLGIRRKTIFALKILNRKDADEFHTWWLHCNGQIKSWWDAAREASAEKKEPTIEIFPCFPASKIEEIVKINPQAVVAPHKPKRKLELVSPRKLWREELIPSEKFASPEAKPPSPQRRKLCDKESVEIESIVEPQESIDHDRPIMQSELMVSFLACLKENKESATAFELEIEPEEFPCNRKFVAHVSGAPLLVCGPLWSAADEAARASKVLAVRKEQLEVDALVSGMLNNESTEDCIDSVGRSIEKFCKSIPTVMIKAIGTDKFLNRHESGLLHDEKLIPFKDRPCDSLPRPMVSNDEEVSNEEEMEAEDPESDILVDDVACATSQQINFV